MLKYGGLFLLCFISSPLFAEPIRLANNPALSPDGSQLAFDWNGDVWIVSSKGGVAKSITTHPGKDREPKFSPDGKEIAFISDREGSSQVFAMNLPIGAPKQLTHHTAGFSLLEYSSDGKSLLVQSARDHYWRFAERFYVIPRHERKGGFILFDDYGQAGTLSPDGKKVLFTRESEPIWHVGYKGPNATQIWLFDRQSNVFKKILHDQQSCRFPLWKPDGKGFYFVRVKNNAGNLCEFDFDSKQEKQLTEFKQDVVLYPAISRDGSTIVFRHLFDLYRMEPGKGPAQKINVTVEGDRLTERKERRLLSTASHAAFTNDGLEIAFTSGGDLWVMDTELREPKQVTTTAGEERSPVFSPKGDAIYYLAERDGKVDLWKAQRKDAKKYWWLNKGFQITQLTLTGDLSTGVRFSPDGTQVVFQKERGDLYLADADLTSAKKILDSWNGLDFDWSPDGKWLVFGQLDSDFNRDIYVMPSDGSKKPINISKHPFNESDPVWSPDGKMIAFAGQRVGGADAAKVAVVWLQSGDNEITSRDKKLEKALEKMTKGRPEPKSTPETPAKEEKKAAKEPAKKEVIIDFDGLQDRLKRIAIGTSGASNLMWSPDSKKLAFVAAIDGKQGLYSIDVGEMSNPKLLASVTGSQGRWLSKNNQIVWLSGGVPASLTPGVGAVPAASPVPIGVPKTKGPALPTPIGGSTPTPPDAGGGTPYTFQVRQEIDTGERHAAIFDQCWRVMRDHWYDGNFGNHDWNAVRQKYRAQALAAPDMDSLTQVIHLMLGELNGSHLGFMAGAKTLPTKAGEPEAGPRDVTGHLGFRIDPLFAGIGLKIRDVIPGGPADLKKSKLKAGEIIRTIDGLPVTAQTDLSIILNGPLQRDILLVVSNEMAKDREVVIRPTTFTAIRSLLYDKWVGDNAKQVEKLSDGKLGYLHIGAMMMPNFYKFEEELYSIGAGKEGLVIDVRENGGGMITDHLLTCLTQPQHAITVPRGGVPGYPHDRKVYGTWNKPVVVLCNQYSFSNAEIFSHAVKVLKRGQVVGVQTGGGVVSTGAAAIMDAGLLRLPSRGWFVLDTGLDMEMNGAMPHHILWPEPGQMPKGKDIQLEKAVEVLSADVTTWRQRPMPKLQRVTEIK